MASLALFGGDKAVPGALAPFRSYGTEESEAVQQVLDSGVLSDFIGARGPQFLGGKRVRQFEDELSATFKSSYAVTFNSWTSGLIAAVGALGLEPGDEVILPTWTMSASATAVLHSNCVPVFADIDPRTFNISLQSIEERLSSKTRAIMAVDIFGQSADMDGITSLAKRLDIRVISDSAQAPGAVYQGRYAGTLADIGGYSLNYHKHIHTGEGGIAFTNDPDLAHRLRLIRNHGEAVVGANDLDSLKMIRGFNFRLGEMEAAIGSAQLKKLGPIIKSRQGVAQRFSDGLRNLVGLTLPFVGENRTHVYYVYAMKIDPAELGVSRDLIVDALLAEGVPVMRRYQNIHLLPFYSQESSFRMGSQTWNLPAERAEGSYSRGACPVAERINECEFVGLPICSYAFDEKESNQVLDAFEKVWSNLPKLRDR